MATDTYDPATFECAACGALTPRVEAHWDGDGREIRTVCPDCCSTCEGGRRR